MVRYVVGHVGGQIPDGFQNILNINKIKALFDSCLFRFCLMAFRPDLSIHFELQKPSHTVALSSHTCKWRLDRRVLAYHA